MQPVQLSFIDLFAAPPPDVGGPGPKCGDAPRSGAAKPASRTPDPSVTGARPSVTRARHHRGRRNYLAGIAAEDSVARRYARGGARISARRWRGTLGELDLVVHEGARVVFVEVKKSDTFDRAATHLTRRQMDRIYATGSEFLGGEPAGQSTETRIDVALVNAHGEIRIIENAIGF